MAQSADVLFEVSGELFAVPAATVSEVLPLAELATPPGLPAGIAGFLNLGETVVPVLRTDRLLDLQGDEPGIYAHLLLLRGRHAPLALLVDRVAAVEVIPERNRCSVADEETFRGCVVGEAVDFGRPVHVLSLDRLISERERSRIAAFRDAELRRRSVLEVSE